MPAPPLSSATAPLERCSHKRRHHESSAQG
jgi:hypothetical protein